MKIEVKRLHFTDKSTIGVMFIDGVRECWTLEDAVRPDGVKIPGETAIPKGIYEVEISMSPRFKRELPLLKNVKNFIGIRIHPGNTAADTEGCILVGRERPDGTHDLITNSKLAFDAMFAKLKEAQKRHEPITLELS